jgi:ParB/RepB/Spo0J family partition protein
MVQQVWAGRKGGSLVAAIRKKAATTTAPELATVPIAELVFNPANPRKHSAEQIERLKASLLRDGQTKPILVRRANHMVIAGHGIMTAAAALGWPSISVLLWDVDQPTADRVMLADNRLSDLSTTDDAMLIELLAKIDEADYLATGFSPAEVTKMLAEVEENISVVEVETSKVEDVFWVTIEGPLTSQAQVLQKVREVMAAFPAVRVELGTVER